jgi:hypothetical protein
MFALGCIIFRVVTGQMAFQSDWEISKYANDMNPIFPERWPPADPGTQCYQIGWLMSTLLAVNPIHRPGASQTERLFHRIGDGKSMTEPVDSLDPVDDPFFNVDDGECLEEASWTRQPMVQPALWSAARVSAPSMRLVERKLDEDNGVRPQQLPRQQGSPQRPHQHDQQQNSLQSQQGPPASARNGLPFPIPIPTSRWASQQSLDAGNGQIPAGTANPRVQAVFAQQRPRVRAVFAQQRPSNPLDMSLNSRLALQAQQVQLAFPHEAVELLRRHHAGSQ